MAERPRGSKEFQRLLQRHAGEIGQLPQRVMHLGVQEMALAVWMIARGFHPPAVSTMPDTDGQSRAHLPS